MRPGAGRGGGGGVLGLSDTGAVSYDGKQP